MVTMKRETEVHDVIVERFVPEGKQNGKVLAAVQAHADDVPLFCAGTIAKLLAEGYTGYLIQTTNDEKCGPSTSIGETISGNERDVDEMAEILGFKGVFNLGYRNHRLDEASPTELRARLIFLFRHLKVDTVLTFNPWGHSEENPDHYVTGQAVEAARWMAGMAKDYPEQVAAGLQPHTVKEQYYWIVRPGQPFNRVVDIGVHINEKIEAMSANKSQGPAGWQGSRLKQRLESKGLHLPDFGKDDQTANYAYIKNFGLGDFEKLGQKYGLEYAEGFHYVPPGGTFIGCVDSDQVEQYIEKNAIPIE